MAALVGWFIGGPTGLVAGAVVGLTYALPYAWALAAGHVYPLTPRGVGLFIT